MTAKTNKYLALLSVAAGLILTVSPRALAASSGADGFAGGAIVFYGCTAAISVLLTLWYALFCKHRDPKFLLLYTCVALSNLGFFLTSVAKTLEFALWANRLSYLGAAYLIMFMLIIVLNICNIRLKKWMYALLVSCSTLAFLIAASGGMGRLYYSEVSIEQVNGATRLIKEYGPLHFTYSLYLFSFFSLMVAVIIFSAVKKRLPSGQYVFFVSAIVSGNVSIWLVEQMVDVDFEFLSVSYVITEILLLLLHGILRDTAPAPLPPADGALPPNLEELFSVFSSNVATLTAAEKRILAYYIEGRETAEIPGLAYVSIHTVKKHNRSIYQKLGVASRDELMLYIELFRRCDRLSELSVCVDQ